MKSRSKEEAILDMLGKAKPSTIKRRGQQSEASEMQQFVRKISRAVLRHPNKDILQPLFLLHKKLAEIFLTMSDEGIDWLLGATDGSRGGFRSTEHETAAQQFKAFLKKDPGTIPPQKLITSIENIATAMAYRTIHANWTKRPFTPETIEQFRMFELLEEMVGPNLVEPINQIYDRDGDIISDETIMQDDEAIAQNVDLEESESAPVKEHKKKPESVVGLAEDVSSTSDEEDSKKVTSKPREKLESFRYNKFAINDNETKDKRLTWAGASLESNISIRAHVSGSAPLTLAALGGLFHFKTKEAKQDKWFKNDENARILSAVLIIATYQRADFHTIAESIAGIEYFLNERVIRANEPIQPHKAFSSALDWLARGASESVVIKGNEEGGDAQTVNLQGIIAALIPNMLRLTKNIEGHPMAFRDHFYRELEDEDVISASSLLRYIKESGLKPPNFNKVWHKLKPILPIHITTAEGFAIVLAFTHPQYHGEIVKAFESKLPAIKTMDSFSEVMRCVKSLPIRNQLYQYYKNQLPSLIKNVFDFGTAMQYFTREQRTELYDHLKQTERWPFLEAENKIERIEGLLDFHSLDRVRKQSLGHVLKYLSSKQCEEVCHHLAKQMPTIIKTESDLSDMFELLDPLQRQVVFLACQDYFLSMVETIEHLETVIKDLDAKQSEVVWHKLDIRLPQIIKSTRDLIIVFEYQEPTRRNGVFDKIKTVLPAIIKYYYDVDRMVDSNLFSEKQLNDIYSIVTSTPSSAEAFIEFLRRKGRQKLIQMVDSLEKKSCENLLPKAKELDDPTLGSMSYTSSLYQRAPNYVPLVLAIKSENEIEVADLLYMHPSSLPVEIENFVKKINNEEIIRIFEEFNNKLKSDALLRNFQGPGPGN